MKKKIEILILGAVEREIKSVQKNVQDAKTFRGKPVSVITGRIGRKKVMVGTTCVGITNAAMSTTSILENYDVGSIFLIGIGGAYENSALEPGDVAVATSEIYGDMGIETKNDWSPMDEIGIPLWNTGNKSFYHVWPVDEKLRSQALRILNIPKAAWLDQIIRHENRVDIFSHSSGHFHGNQHGWSKCPVATSPSRRTPSRRELRLGELYEPEAPVHENARSAFYDHRGCIYHGKRKTFSISFGPFVTVSCISGDQKRAALLEKRFRGICENMEGAAVAHVSLAYGVPFLECRGISNIAGIRDKTTWRMEEAIQNCTEIVLRLLQNQ